MFEIVAVIALLLAILLAIVLLPVLLVFKVAQSLFKPAVDEVVSAVEEVREEAWRKANASEREKLVRKSCGWRVIGRVVGAGALVTGAFITASPTLVIMWCVAAWRVVKSVKQEMRDAGSYRSTGANDEPPYSW
jgi:hypothetical protein